MDSQSQSPASLALAEQILAQRFGSGLRLALQIGPAGGSQRSTVLRCQVLDGPSAAPPSVILKQVNLDSGQMFKVESLDQSAQAFLNEYASLTFLTRLAAVRARITTVCIDMWEGYVTAVEETLPAATIVIDRFHVARHYRDAVDTLRKQEVKRLRKELLEPQHDALTEIMWPLRKRPADLTDEEHQRLARLFALSPALERAYTLREELTTIFDTAIGGSAPGEPPLHLGPVTATLEEPVINPSLTKG